MESLADRGAAERSPGADLSPSVAARHTCRAGMATTTAGVANGFVQGNLAILPEKLSASFHRFCQLNPKPCPVIGMSDVGDPRIPSLGIDLDIRTDLPRYRIWRDGAVVEEPTDIMAHWRADLVAFVLGCSVAQIAKSLVFKTTSGLPVLVIASGANRVDEAKVSALVGETIGRADAAFVRECTGYAIGGIPPLARRQGRSPDPWWCRCGRSNRPTRSAPCRSPRGFLRCMARRFISGIRIRSASRISPSRIMAMRCRWKPTKFPCSGPAASLRRR